MPDFEFVHISYFFHFFPFQYHANKKSVFSIFVLLFSSEEVDHKYMAFLIVSDDMAWAKKNIKNKKGDVFFVGIGVPDVDLDIGTDLAIMAYANATIISRGTFGMWGAILCGGEYHTEFGLMVPEHIMDPHDEFYHQEYIL